MKYEEFKEEAVKALKEFYGDKVDVELGEALKNNGKRYDTVSIRVRGRNSSVVPAVYLEEFFRMYDAGNMDMEGCVKGIVELREEREYSVQTERFAGRLLDWEFVRGKVYPALLSTKENKELLGNLVSKSLLDLSVIYIIRDTTDGENSCSAKITCGMMEAYGISEEQLYQQAINNLEGDGYCFCEIRKYIQGMISGGEEQERKDVDSLEDGKMYILRNPSGLYGAAGILYGKLLRNTAKGHDCFILPSSIHETIFLPVSAGQNQKELDDMVAEINKMCVGEEERLADHSYYYDAETGGIRICA